MSNNPNEKKAHLFVISSPSGGGKSTIIKRILEIRPNLKYSISATTRPRRTGEIDGRSYQFLNHDDFRKMIENGEFIEYEKVHDDYYGTPKSAIEKTLADGKNIVLDLDVKGALHLKDIYPNTALIFLLPPSIEVLRNRLLNRRREHPEEIELRLKRMEIEMEASTQFDFKVMNDDLDKAVNEAAGIIDAVIEASDA